MILLVAGFELFYNHQTIAMIRIILSSFLVLFILASCQKEVDSVIGNNNNNNNGGSNNTNCKACIYLPYCDGATYTYYDTIIGNPMPPSTDALKFIKDTVFSRKTFQKFTATGSSSGATVYTNCTNGITTLAVLNVAVTGGTVSKIELRPLQANLLVNGAWNDTVTNGLGQTVIYKYTIREKGITKIIGSNTFNDVIHVETISGVDFPGLGYIVTNKSDYYYAKGVGLIEALITSEDGSIVYQHRVIKSYNIP